MGWKTNKNTAGDLVTGVGVLRLLSSPMVQAYGAPHSHGYHALPRQEFITQTATMLYS